MPDRINELTADEQRLGELRRGLESNVQRGERAVRDLERELARAEGAGDERAAVQIRAQIDGVKVEHRRAEAALAANRELLDDVHRRLSELRVATTTDRARNDGDALSRVTHESFERVMRIGREQIAPILAEFSAAKQAALESEAEMYRAQGKMRPYHPPVIDRVGAEVPGALAVLSGLAAIFSGEPFHVMPASMVAASGVPMDAGRGLTAPRTEALKRIRRTTGL
jgi:hypothetical protein